jgi:hypothetical protein
MRTGKLLIGGAAALAALVARLGRRAEDPRPEPAPRPEPEPERAEADEIAADEVRELREELRRELERLSRPSRAHSAEPSASGCADIKASRTRRESTSPPG